MFILNPEKVKHKKYFNKSVSGYLENNGVPLLSIQGNKYYFADSEILEKVISDAPAWVKLSILFTQ